MLRNTSTRREIHGIDRYLGGKVVGVDTTLFIYFIERNPTYVDIARASFQVVDRGECKAVTSVISLKAEDKPMTSETYRKALQMARGLPVEEQLQLIEDLISLARHRVQAKPAHNITELRGLGKEIWEGVDVEKYINEERNSWDR